MVNINKKHKWSYYFGRESAKDAIEGWDEQKINSLPPEEREWMLQFLLEYSGQASTPVISRELCRHGWATKRRFYLDGFVGSIPLNVESPTGDRPPTLSPIPQKVEETNSEQSQKSKTKSTKIRKK